MTCPQHSLWIGAYIDGELSGKERDDMESHLATCTQCVTLAEELRRIDLAAADDAVPQVTGEEWTLLWNQVERGASNATPAAPPTLWRITTWRWGLAAAAAISIFALGVLAGRAWSPAPPEVPAVGQIPSAADPQAPDTAELPADSEAAPASPEVFHLPFSSF